MQGNHPPSRTDPAALSMLRRIGVFLEHSLRARQADHRRIVVAGAGATRLGALGRAPGGRQTRPKPSIGQGTIPELQPGSYRMPVAAPRRADSLYGGIGRASATRVRGRSCREQQQGRR